MAQLSVSNLGGRKNFIINGCGRIAQRGSTSLTGVAKYGGADRFQTVLINATAGTIIRPNGLSGVVTKKGHGVSGASCTSGGVLAFEQRIESSNSVYLNGKTITFSAKLYHDFGSEINFYIVLYKPNAEDDYSSITQLVTSNAISCVSGDYTNLIFTHTLGSSDVTHGLRVQIYAADLALTNKECYIGDVQLEIGSLVTPFEYKPFSEELALCRRYYEKSYPLTTAPGTITSNGREIFHAPTTAYYYMVQYQTEKRTNTTATKVYSPITGTVDKVYNSSTSADVSITTPNEYANGFEQRATVEAAGNIIIFHWTADAEL